MTQPILHIDQLKKRFGGFVALDGALVGLGVVADAGDELDFVRQFDEVIVGPGGEGLCLDGGLFLRGKDDDGRLLRAGIGAELADERQAVAVATNKMTSSG